MYVNIPYMDGTSMHIRISERQFSPTPVLECHHPRCAKPVPPREDVVETAPMPTAEVHGPLQVPGHWLNDFFVGKWQGLEQSFNQVFFSFFFNGLWAVYSLWCCGIWLGIPFFSTDKGRLDPDIIGIILLYCPPQQDSYGMSCLSTLVH